MNTDGNTAAVVLHRHGVITPDRYINRIAIASQRLVNRVIHDLVYEMVQTLFTGRADVHRGTEPNGFQPLQNFDTTSVIFVWVGVGGCTHQILIGMTM